MDKQNNTFFFVFIAVILLMLFGVGFYLYSVFSSSSSSEGEISVNKSEILTRDSININADRVNGYTEKDSVSEPSRLNIDWSKMNFKGKKKPSEEENIEKTQTKEYSTQRTVTKTVSNNYKKPTVQKDTTQTVKKEEPIKEESGGFGVMVTSRTQQVKREVTNTEPTESGQNGFVAAMLEEDTDIKENTSVVFFLLEDCTLNGILFKKNSICYGKAYLNGNAFDISINQIMNTNNKMYSTRNLFVYDEKYSRGLSGEGNLNEAVREGTNQTTDETSGAISSTAAGNAVTGGNIAIRTLNNTIKAMTRKKEPVISIFKGYKVFIKQD